MLQKCVCANISTFENWCDMFTILCIHSRKWLSSWWMLTSVSYVRVEFKFLLSPVTKISGVTTGLSYPYFCGATWTHTTMLGRIALDILLHILIHVHHYICISISGFPICLCALPFLIMKLYLWMLLPILIFTIPINFDWDIIDAHTRNNERCENNKVIGLWNASHQSCSKN